MFGSRTAPPQGPRRNIHNQKPGSLAPGMWEPETLDLLRRFSEPGSDIARQALLAQNEADPAETVLGRSLSHVQHHYVESRGLAGRVTFDAKLPGLEAPEGPLRSMLEHLVDGGLRGNESRNPYCHVGVSDEDETSVTFYLRDNGVAIPECSLDQIREFIHETKVEQVPDRIYRLFLADNLARWVGGSMWVGPTANRAGTTVFLKLPKESTARAPQNPLLARHVF